MAESAVNVFCETFLCTGMADWMAECRHCGYTHTSDTWERAMEAAYGHLCMEQHYFPPMKLKLQIDDFWGDYVGEPCS